MSLAKPPAIVLSLLFAVVAAAQSPEIVGGVVREPVLARLGSDRFRNPGAVWSLAYSPDAKQIAAGCDNSIRFWNATDGRRIRSIALDEHQFVALRYTPDGRSLFAAAVTYRGMRLCCFDPSTGNVRSNVPVRRHRCEVVFRADASYVALWPHDQGIVQVVNLTTGGDWVERIRGDSVEAAAFRGDGKVLAVGTKLSQVRQYDPRNGKLLSECAESTRARLASWHTAPMTPTS